MITSVLPESDTLASLDWAPPCDRAECGRQPAAWVARLDVHCCITGVIVRVYCEPCAVEVRQAWDIACRRCNAGGARLLSLEPLRSTT